MDACASLAADVLCLQEVDRNQSRSGGVDQTAVVARATGAAWWRFEPALLGEPGARWRAAEPEEADRGAGAAYGVGLVSRRPVEEWYVVRLAAARVRAPVLVPGSHRFILLPDEPRVALVADVGPFVVATTHLSFVPGWNAVQLRRLTTALAARGRPCVLLGDFNLPGPFPQWASSWRPMARLKTYPADNPSWQVDHALGFGDLPEVVGVAAPRLPLSDHRALLLDLRESR